MMTFLFFNHDHVLNIDPLMSICCVCVDFGINKISKYAHLKDVHPCDPAVDL